MSELAYWKHMFKQSTEIASKSTAELFRQFFRAKLWEIPTRLRAKPVVGWMQWHFPPLILKLWPGKGAQSVWSPCAGSNERVTNGQIEENGISIRGYFRNSLLFRGCLYQLIAEILVQILPFGGCLRNYTPIWDHLWVSFRIIALALFNPD